MYKVVENIVDIVEIIMSIFWLIFFLEVVYGEQLPFVVLIYIPRTSSGIDVCFIAV